MRIGCFAMSKQIILFDSWSFGFKFFEHYVPHLKAAGYHIVFAHMDKLQSPTLNIEKSNELKEYSNYVKTIIECYDVSTQKNLETLREKYPTPCVVLHLSISHLENRVFNTFYRGNTIRAYVQHGNIFGSEGAKTTIKNQSKIQTVFSSTFGFKLFKIARLFLMYSKKSSRLEFFHLLLQWFAGPRKFIWLPRKHRSLVFDLAFSFSGSEAEFLSEIYGIDKHRIHTLTNPEVYKLSLYLKGGVDIPRNLIFIDQALIEAGLLDRSKQIDDIKLFHKIADSQGMIFKIKLHPRTSSGTYADVPVDTLSDDLTKLVSKENIFIGYNSSLLKTMLLLGLDVVHYAPENDLRSESVVYENEAFPNYYITSNADMLEETLKELRNFNEFGRSMQIEDPATLFIEQITNFSASNT